MKWGLLPISFLGVSDNPQSRGYILTRQDFVAGDRVMFQRKEQYYYTEGRIMRGEGAHIVETQVFCTVCLKSWCLMICFHSWSLDLSQENTGPKPMEKRQKQKKHKKNKKLQPTAHCLLWKGQQLCRACNKSFKHVIVFLHFYKGTVHNSLQKAGLFSRCMIFSQNTCSRYSSLLRKCISKVSVALSCTKRIVSLQMMPGKGLDSIVVKPSFEEVHVQSGHVLLWKALMNSMKGCRTFLRKCRIRSWKLHSCLFNIKYIFSRNINDCEKAINLSNSVCIYIIHICTYGNIYNNIMQNSTQASKSLYVDIFYFPKC